MRLPIRTQRHVFIEERWAFWESDSSCPPVSLPMRLHVDSKVSTFCEWKKFVTPSTLAKGILSLLRIIQGTQYCEP